METNARYVTIGCFALAAIAACLGFVFWLNRTGSLAQQDTYEIRFGNQVSGLQPGAAVLFDGIRVGGVTRLRVDPSDPRRILAAVSVIAGTPVRLDTKVGIASQGLMGTVGVSLEGGSPDAPPPARNGELFTLVADPTVGRSLTQSAEDTLGRVDAILSDNSDAIKSTMDSLKTFSAALARNAGRVDTVMAGLAQMTGGGSAKVPAPVYDLAVPKMTGFPDTLPPGQIVIGMPTTIVALQTQRLLTRSPDGQLTSVGEMQWSDTLPALLQQKVLQSFEDAGFAVTATPPTDYGKDDRQLQLDLRRFDIQSGGDRVAEIVFSAKILSGDGRVLGTRVFDAKVPATSTDDAALARDLGVAFDSAVVGLGTWISRPLGSAMPNQSRAKPAQL